MIWGGRSVGQLSHLIFLLKTDYFRWVFAEVIAYISGIFLGRSRGSVNLWLIYRQSRVTMTPPPSPTRNN